MFLRGWFVLLTLIVPNNCLQQIVHQLNINHVDTAASPVHSPRLTPRHNSGTTGRLLEDTGFQARVQHENM